MTRFKRRMLFGLALFALVLLGLGVWLYFAFFASTSTALQRAEAFLFRRMKVAQLAEQGDYRFFYVTNRRPEGDDGPLEERFGKDLRRSSSSGFLMSELNPHWVSA